MLLQVASHVPASCPPPAQHQPRPPHAPLPPVRVSCRPRARELEARNAELECELAGMEEVLARDVAALQADHGLLRRQVRRESSLGVDFMCGWVGGWVGGWMEGP